MLEEKLSYVLKLLEEKGLKKDSHNSHNPPSQDKGTIKRKSLRDKSGRKSGGQKGHTGVTLEQRKDPDEIHKLVSNNCSKCGILLKPEDQKLLLKRQIVEIPPIKPIYIEYQQYGCDCKNCGHQQKSPFPENVNCHIKYGNSILSLVSYYSVYQYIPYARLTEQFKDIFNLPISEGSIENLLNRAAKKSAPIYDEILTQLIKSNYAGSDETGAKVNGDKWWIWVWQNLLNTYIAASKSRGFSTIENIIGNKLSHSIIGSDRWAAQLKLETKGKQLCTAHLLRDLIYLEELENNPWTKDFIALLKHGHQLNKESIERNKAFEKTEQKTLDIERDLNKLLARSINKDKTPKTFSFQKSMIKHRNSIFTFLYHLDVPPDNNASERAIRNIKVKQKISGQFKSGQDAFCIIRSCIDTLKKRNLNVYSYLCDIMNLNNNSSVLVPE